VLPSGPTLRPVGTAPGRVLVIGVDGVRLDHGHLDQGGHGGREPEVATAWAAAAGPGIAAGAAPLITHLVQVAPLVLAALGERGS
jgi:hypothetical protein